MIDYNMVVRILTQQDLLNAGCFDINASIQVCEKAFLAYANDDVIFPDKTSVVFEQKTQNRINCLPAGILSESVYGMKWVSVFPNNPQMKAVPNLTAIIVLSELDSGFPVAFMEGSLCSNLRTASVGAIAAEYFARRGSETIGFIGAGEQAKAHFLTMKAVRPQIKVCKIASRTENSEKMFVKQMKKFYPEVQFVTCSGNYQEAVCDADIIVTAISGQEKILQADWIKTGAFYCHVAGLEDEFTVAKMADKIVCDSWNVVKHRTQTISRMYELGMLSDEDIYADLHEVVSGQKGGRENEKEFIYFNSVGLSFVDIALANWMYEKAKAEEIGQLITLKDKSMFDM